LVSNTSHILLAVEWFPATGRARATRLRGFTAMREARLPNLRVAGSSPVVRSSKPRSSKRDFRGFRGLTRHSSEASEALQWRWANASGRGKASDVVVINPLGPNHSSPSLGGTKVSSSAVRTATLSGSPSVAMGSPSSCDEHRSPIQYEPADPGRLRRSPTRAGRRWPRGHNDGASRLREPSRQRRASRKGVRTERTPLPVSEAV
jgi:hypothetical protein